MERKNKQKKAYIFWAINVVSLILFSFIASPYWLYTTLAFIYLLSFVPAIVFSVLAHKKTKEERTHEEIVRTLSNLTINTQALKGYSNKYWVLSKLNIDNKDIPLQMRNYLLSIEKSKTKKLKRGKI